MTELADIAEQLKEARRYVRTKAPEARRPVDICIVNMAALPAVDSRGLPRVELIRRLMRSLSGGLEYIQVSPCVLEGYIDGAVFELGLKGE